MKIRTDFVTNSSSSSFIVAWRPAENPSDVEKLADILIKGILSYDDCYTTEAEMYSTEEDLQKFLHDWEYQSEEELMKDGGSIKKEFVKMKECISAGIPVYYKSVEDCNSTIPYLLHLLRDEVPGFTIIRDGDF